MTLNDAKNAADQLSKINLDIWNASNANDKERLRSTFRSIYRDVIKAGFKVMHRKVFDGKYGYKVPKFKIREDKSEDLVSIVDNRDPNGYHKGDCTTRCISFCTGIDYLTIQREQFANAKSYNSYGVTWRSPRIWSMSLTSRGFCKIALPKHMSGKVFLRKFSNCGIDNGIIAAESAHHIAAIDMKAKKILDTWNSAGCRIRSIYVPIFQKDIWENTINSVLKKITSIWQSQNFRSCLI